MSVPRFFAVVCAAVLLAGCSTSSSEPSDGTENSAGSEVAGQDDAEVSTEAPEPAELPRGGREIFPDYRLFGYSGAPGSEALGRLGIGDLDERVVEMEERGQEFAGGREQLPTLELIATIVHPVAGDDGMFRTRVSDEIVQDYLDAARRHDGILLLNIQPGRGDFIDEVKYWEEFLVEPDVGVALDPEWAIEEGQIPGQVYGRTTGAELDEVAVYLEDLVAENDLPEKVMVYHQVHVGVVENEDDLKEHDGVVLIKSVDGIGDAQSKIDTYNVVNENKPPHVYAGFKLFYEEDAEYGPIMTGTEVLGLTPEPEYILFE
ncbi:hypothetical protein K0651_04445 [Ornithinimicrobium sp. Arc0846-15]|nr:hypothetical protein [Ornithinimicrobium laminariae]